MNLPPAVSSLIARLNGSGFSAYAVGGCVRDALLAKAPHDWDLCTSARPEQMLEVFRGEHVVETGLKHGTLTVVLDHVPYEITTFRTDGVYTDHRHPDSVTFVSDVAGDLARRDFTVNAMAYAPREGLVDLFGGREDLQKKIIRSKRMLCGFCEPCASPPFTISPWIRKRIKPSVSSPQR